VAVPSSFRRLSGACLGVVPTRVYRCDSLFGKTSRRGLSSSLSRDSIHAGGLGVLKCQGLRVGEF